MLSKASAFYFENKVAVYFSIFGNRAGSQAMIIWGNQALMAT